MKKEKDFNTSFQFITSIAEYTQDTWDDVDKYIKRREKATKKLYNKIKTAREKNEYSSQVCISYLF